MDPSLALVTMYIPFERRISFIAYQISARPEGPIVTLETFKRIGKWRKLLLKMTVPGYFEKHRKLVCVLLFLYILLLHFFPLVCTWLLRDIADYKKML